MSLNWLWRFGIRKKVQNIHLSCGTDNCMEHGLTWYIDDFLVHIQKSILCFFTSLTQCINLQEKLENSDWPTVPWQNAELVNIQLQSILTRHQHVACNHVCFDSGVLVFPSCGVTSAVRLMTDAFRLSRARACPRQPVLKRAGLSLSIVRVRVCVCESVCSSPL